MIFEYLHEETIISKVKTKIWDNICNIYHGLELISLIYKSYVTIKKKKTKIPIKKKKKTG